MTKPLSADTLRWICDPESIPFASTDEIDPLPGVVGQEAALEALRFGLMCDAPGQNVFVRGLTGTGRMTLVRQTLEDLRTAQNAAPTPPEERPAFCYVHNFSSPDQPRLITLRASEARTFKRRVRELAEYVRDELGDALNEPHVKAEREELERRRQDEIERLTAEFQKELLAAGLDLAQIQRGPMTLPVIVPRVEDKPVSPEEFERLYAAGTVSEEEYEGYREKRRSFQKRLGDINNQVRLIQRQGNEEIRSMVTESARQMLAFHVDTLREDFPGDDVGRFLDEVLRDILEIRLFEEEDFEPVNLYGVNVLLDDSSEGQPIIEENNPGLTRLLGSVEREWGPQGPEHSDYRMIRPGSLLRANGGFLILDARDVLSEPGAWKILTRTLRTGFLEIVPAELGMSFFRPSLKPEPIPVKVRVILLGDSWLYHALGGDDDFVQLFKVLADFDNVIDRETENVHQYGRVLARIASEEGLPAFDRTAIAAIAEHGARVAGHHGKLTARFGRMADIAREAAFLARQASDGEVQASHVIEAVRRTKERASLPARRFREHLRDGTINVMTSGEVVGQINGLAMIHAGPITYGFPARITATISAGNSGLINIEGQAAMSGSIHTKGFYILGGLLRHLLRVDHPLAFSASLAFEQSYGGIDGDSASGAESCCLLSALTGIPIRQSLAMTGAIDQHGRIQAIGGATEKIEGFFDTCVDYGLDGTQGCIIPQANVGDLMLRADVVEAAREGKFHVYAVSHVREALEVLTGVPAGEPDEDGVYPEGTLLGRAVEKTTEYWRKSLQRPMPVEDADED